MFQKHSIMSLKKKSKSLGHLTALGSHPGSPDVEPKVRGAGDEQRRNSSRGGEYEAGVVICSGKG